MALHIYTYLLSTRSLYDQIISHMLGKYRIMLMSSHMQCQY